MGAKRQTREDGSAEGELRALLANVDRMEARGGSHVYVTCDVEIVGVKTITLLILLQRHKGGTSSRLASPRLAAWECPQGPRIVWRIQLQRGTRAPSLRHAYHNMSTTVVYKPT